MRVRPHPRVVGFRGIKSHDKKLLLFEYLPLGDLEKMVKSGDANFEKPQIIRLLWDVAIGMNHITKEGIIFRDLALRNLLLCREHLTGDELRVKIADFGYASIADSHNVSKEPISNGPWRIMAPETLKPSPEFSQKSDVWSFGIVIYCLITKKRPYPDIKLPDSVREAILNGTRLTIDPLSYPEFTSLLPLFHSCTTEDPSLRPTFEELCSLLSEMYNTAMSERVLISLPLEKDLKEEKKDLVENDNQGS
eukprot:TRINITY_DN5128_c0_g1_i1.p1 TRINITY_DN5128_c0_g1~~TRINITY_DN5128_c0_g1_i1.p1  ORF type:complete len:250 (+),score=35.57 TRINITY_DN5128_c0_g1_i1:365-1114(+)